MRRTPPRFSCAAFLWHRPELVYCSLFSSKFDLLAVLIAVNYFFSGFTETGRSSLVAQGLF